MVIGCERRHFRSLDSTFSIAREWADADACHGAVVTADLQTGGRGRLGRGWQSPQGGLYMTIILRPEFEVSRWPLISLCAALSAVEAVDTVCEGALVKWPNDVVLSGKKIAGLLLETGGAAQNRYCLLGVGINASQKSESFSAEGLEHASSLELLCGRAVDGEALISAFMHALTNRYKMLENSDEMGMLTAYRGRSATIGRRVRVVGRDGEEIGTALDVNNDGALLFAPDGEEQRLVYAADVSVRGLMGYV